MLLAHDLAKLESIRQVIGKKVGKGAFEGQEKHSENKTIKHFENEVRPGVLQFGI